MEYKEFFSSFSVPDLNAAADFYTNVLDLEVGQTMEGLELKLGDTAPVFVYFSAHNKPADFTVLNFGVDDIESKIEELGAKGVVMEQYDMPDFKTDERGIVTWEGGRKMAWFKDPAGNIFSLIEN